MTDAPKPAPKQPINPLVILALAIVLPGAGQVFNREPVRGLIFVCFAVLLCCRSRLFALFIGDDT